MHKKQFKINLLDPIEQMDGITVDKEFCPFCPLGPHGPIKFPEFGEDVPA
jgi:hypothetical protein